jgi:hypothetical protein
MKIIITIGLFLVITIGHAQNWADSLAKFERKDSKRTYGWFDSLTAAKQVTHVQEWFSLKVKASIEARLVSLSDSTTNAANQNNYRLAYIAHLKTLGYVCDNSKTDWRKAYNHPEIWGENWRNKADIAWAASTGLNDFLNFCRQYNIN